MTTCENCSEERGPLTLIGDGLLVCSRCVRANKGRPGWDPIGDEPVHRPAAPDAPIPGRQWFGGCDPDLPRVAASGVCRGCGETACPECGYERYPDGECGCKQRLPVAGVVPE